MTRTVQFESILPAIVLLTAALAAAWLGLWLVSRVLDRLARSGDGADDGGSAREIAGKLKRLLFGAVSVATFLIATLILLHGVGITAFPPLSWEALAGWWRAKGVALLFIMGSAAVLVRALHLVSQRMSALAGNQGPLADRIERRKRLNAGGRLLRWTGTAVIVGVAGVMALKTLGVDVSPLLTGGAIVSVALGFGAQHLVRDVITGVFMIVENQVRVGDIAIINGKGGLVETIRLRTIVLRGLDGTVHIFPNGAITALSNMTKDFSYYVIDVGVAYRENVDRVIDVLQEIGATLAGDAGYAPKILAPLEVLGVDDFADSAVVIKVRIKTVPLEQWNVGRELRRRIKNRFDELGIEIPYPHLSVYFGAQGKPFAVAMAEAGSKGTTESGPESDS